MKNTRKNSGITLSLNESGQIIQEPGFQLFTSMCLFRNAAVYLWRMGTLLHCLPKIPTLTSPIEPQLWLRNLPCPFALTWRRGWHEVPVGIRKCGFWQVISKIYHTPRPNHHIWTVTYWRLEPWHLNKLITVISRENLLSDFRRIFSLRTILALQYVLLWRNAERRRRRRQCLKRLWLDPVRLKASDTNMTPREFENRAPHSRYPFFAFSQLKFPPCTICQYQYFWWLCRSL